VTNVYAPSSFDVNSVSPPTGPAPGRDAV
jgi:hypothetical protein